MTPTRNRQSKAAKPRSDAALSSPGFLRAALDCLQTNVFMADSQFNIIYMNDPARATLRKIESAVSKTFGVSVDEMLGGSIHRFHKDPRKIEQILRNPKALPHEATFSFGAITLQAKINGIFGRDQEILGYIVCWEDISYRLKLELDYAGQIAAIGKVQAVIEFEIDGTIITANDNFLNLMEYKLDEVKGRAHKMFVDAGYAGSNEYRQFWADSLQGDPTPAASAA